jgi:1-aminocyclopropane-1-carboxylate deaminase
MQPLLPKSITVDEIDLPILKEKNVRLAVLRLDTIHPVISGNKWFKLKYHIEIATKEKIDHIITFGGPHSNHIIATAAAGNLFGFSTTGIIRGQRPRVFSNALDRATEYGMNLIFTSREDYRSKQLPIEIDKTKDFYLIDEGGYGTDGARGAAEILGYCQKEEFSHVICAVGTSTMLAGLIKASLPSQQIMGVSVLKNNTSIENDLFNLLDPDEQKKEIRLIHQYHFGGYAKYTIELTRFMNEFFDCTGIPSDFVYTGKLFYAVIDMVKNNSFPPESNILAIHSGGLQGNLSLRKGTLIF